MRQILFVARVFIAAGIVQGLTLWPASVLAQAPPLDRAAWIGVKVMPKLDAEVKGENGVIDEKKLSLPWVVQNVKGDSLYVGDEEKGWVRSSQVVAFGAAPTYYTSIIERGEHLVWAYDHRATSWKLIGELDLAIADFGEELRLEPSADAFSGRGATWASKEEYDKAIDDFDQVIRLEPYNATAYRYRGAAWFSKNDYDKSIDDFTEAISLDPDDAWSYGKRGAAWGHKEEFDKAIDDLNQTIHRDPGDSVAFYNRGYAWCRKKNFDNAIDDLSQAIRLNPSYLNAYLNRGRAWSLRREFDKAIADFDQAIRLDPKCGAAYTSRGALWACKREFDKAIADFTQEIQLDRDSESYFRRGKVWELKKEYDKAIADYDEAMRIDPNNGRLLNHTAWLLATCPDAQCRQGARAVELATKACEFSKWTNRATLDTLAAAYAENGDFDAATEWQQKGIDLAPNDVEFTKGANERLALYREKQPYQTTNEAADIGAGTNRCQ